MDERMRTHRHHRLAERVEPLRGAGLGKALEGDEAAELGERRSAKVRSTWLGTTTRTGPFPARPPERQSVHETERTETDPQRPGVAHRSCARAAGVRQGIAVRPASARPAGSRHPVGER